MEMGKFKSEGHAVATHPWPPRASASSYDEGTELYGSTGQLWRATNGQWVRVGDVPVKSECAHMVNIKTV